MTPLAEVEVRLSEVRKRLAAIGAAELNDDVRAELDNLRAEYTDLETRSQALRMGGESEPEKIEKRADHGEDLELRELRDSVQFGTYVAAAIGGHPVFNGAEAEYNQHLGLEAHQFPLELLGRNLETRAVKTDGEAEVSAGTWLDRVFAESMATRVGFSMRTVPAGISAYPVTTAGPTALQRGRDEAITESPSFAYSVTEIKPARRSVHASYSIEDNARMVGLSGAIERDLRAAMVDGVDKAVFNSDAGANENAADIVGMRTAGINEVTLTQANKVKGPETLALYAAMIDGKYASMPSDLNIVASVGTNVLYMTNLVNSTASNETLGEFLKRAGVMWGVREGIDTNTANGDFGVYVGMNRGIEGAAIAAMWEGGELIRDPYTEASKGNMLLTMHYLWQTAYPRTDNFRRIKYVT